MFLYIPIEEEFCAPELGLYRSFGIRVENEAGEAVAVISDISTDAEMVRDLAGRCTTEELSPEHLLDIVINHI